MREFTAPLIPLCLIILLAGCSAGNPIQLCQVDTGRTIRMEPADTLKIVLDANPTTGYQWKALPWETKVIEQIDKPVYKPKSEAIGSGGESTFRFRALTTGRTSLKFIYYRAFEKGVPPVKSFRVTVVVSE